MNLNLQNAILLNISQYDFHCIPLDFGKIPTDLMGFHWMNPMDPIRYWKDTIGFDVISLDESHGLNWFWIGFNFLSIDFELVPIDFNLWSIGFNLLPIGFDLMSIY